VVYALSHEIKIIDLGWPWKSLTTSTIGYSTDSWASCRLKMKLTYDGMTQCCRSSRCPLFVTTLCIVKSVINRSHAIFRIIMLTRKLIMPIIQISKRLWATFLPLMVCVCLHSHFLMGFKWCMFSACNEVSTGNSRWRSSKSLISVPLESARAIFLLIGPIDCL